MKIEPVRNRSDYNADAYDARLNRPTPELDKPVPEKIDPVKSMDKSEIATGRDAGKQDITFGVDEESELLVAKVVDQKSGEVVRSVPPELTIEMAREIRRAQKKARE